MLYDVFAPLPHHHYFQDNIDWKLPANNHDKGVVINVNNEGVLFGPKMPSLITFKPFIKKNFAT